MDLLLSGDDLKLVWVAEGGAMMQLGTDWALNPPKNCPKCKGRVKSFFINFELDKVREKPRFPES